MEEEEEGDGREEGAATAAEAEGSRKKGTKQRCGGEEGKSLEAWSLSTPLSPSMSTPILPPRFASRARTMTPPPRRYSALLPPGPGEAFERIAERAEVLRKPGDGGD